MGLEDSEREDRLAGTTTLSDVNQWTSTHGLNHDVDFEFVDNEKNGLIVCLIRRQWIGPIAFLDKNGNPEESSARCTR